MNTIADEDYLKAIYILGLTHSPVSTTALADHLGYSPATVTEMFQKLAKRGWVIYELYQGVTLTDSGRLTAMNVLRRHRLLETFLVSVLGVSWDKVHTEAENLEHAISDDLLDRIDEYLEFPGFDPHGSPIPTRNGQLVGINSIQLKETQLGQIVQITQVIDKEASSLIVLDRVGIRPGIRIVISSQFPHKQGLKFKVNDQEFFIDNSTMEMVFVRVIDNDHDMDLQ